MTDFRAIETTYNGHRFRSRTEAKWAVFFDAIGVKWEYEKDGYDLGAEGLYLPDFWLPESGVYAEVKGPEFTVTEVNRCRTLARLSARPVVMLPGAPEARNYRAEIPNGLLGEHAWAVDASVLIQAADRARQARFEHGEKPSNERITAISRGARPAQHGQRGMSAERELIRTMLKDYSQVSLIVQIIPPEDFQDPAYRSVYVALIEGEGIPDGEARRTADEIEAEGSLIVDAERTKQDSIATLRARKLDARAAELDRLIPLTDSGEQKDRLIEEKERIRGELRNSGRNYFKRFRR